MLRCKVVSEEGGVARGRSGRRSLRRLRTTPNLETALLTGFLLVSTTTSKILNVTSHHEMWLMHTRASHLDVYLLPIAIRG
jgi:hypothetical protein